MQAKLLRIGSFSFALAALVALVGPPARAADDDAKPKADGDQADTDKPKRKKKAAEGDDTSAAPPADDTAAPKPEGDDEEKPRKRRRRKTEDDEATTETAPKPAKVAAVDDTAGLKEVGPDSYAATSPLGRVKIDRELPTEVGHWGWSWFGDANMLSGAATGGDFKISMVGVRNWISPKIGWEAGTGLTVTKAAGPGAPTQYCWGFTGGLLYSLARYQYVNIFAAGHAVLVPVCDPTGTTTDPTTGTKVSGASVFQFGLSAEVAVEIFLDAFQIFHEGPMVKTSRSMSITFGSGLALRYTHYGDQTVTLPDGTSTSGGAASASNMSTTSVVNSMSNFAGTPTGSVAFTYYF